MPKYCNLALAAVFALCCLHAAAQEQDPAPQYGQFAPPDAFENGSPLAYYGSENPWDRRMFSAETAREQPNRLSQRELLAVIDGDPAGAAETCRESLADHPNDLESLFVLSIAYCALNETDKALAAMERALRAGLPLERFVAGPQELLRPLTESERFKQLVAKQNIRLVHGPMLGAATDRSVRFWVRTEKPAKVAVQVFEIEDSRTPGASSEAMSDLSTDRTAICEVTGLRPNTRYWYDVSVDGEAVALDRRPSFRTYPHLGDAGKYRVAFGGCAGYTPEHERMWDTIASFDPLAFCILGDNVYIDLPGQPGPLHRFSYYQRQSRPEFRRLVSRTPIYAIWDDHDCAMDDVWMGPYLDKPAWKQPMLSLFMQNWNNPTYGDRRRPACWCRFSVGDIDFFLLDGRFYRTNPFGPKPTMLGPEQKEWLLNGLAQSRATFKVLMSPVAWVPSAKPGSHDTWDGFPDEREEIFTLIEDKKIDGVVLISADRHRSDAWRIARPRGYDLYDFMSSRLTNVHTHECVEGALFCYNEKCSFGLLEFDTTAADPSVKYSIVNIDGQTMHDLTIRQSQLSATGSP